MISGVVRQLLAPALAVCLIAVLLWPAFYNGGPFLDSDTPAYARYADTAVAKLTKHQSTWAQSHAAAQVEGPHGADSGSSADHKAPFAGRSIYYGALLALGNAFGMWPSIFLQAAMLLATVALTLVETIGLTARSISIATIALALTTPVAFFASRLMPDAFAGVAILALANLFVYGARMTGWRLLAWTGLLAASLLMHSSHVLIALTLTALGAIGRQTLRWPLSWRGMSCAFIALAIALMGEAAFVLVTKAAFGVSPIRPPFLTARLIADGPGEAYLRQTCPASGFVMCRYLDRLPVASANAFLWSPDPAEGGVFSPADQQDRRAMSAEQTRFAFAVLRFDPLGEAIAMARNAANQAVMISMAPFNLDQHDKTEFDEELPPQYLAAAQNTRSWIGEIPTTAVSAIVTFVLWTSLGYLASVMVPRCGATNEQRNFAIVIVLGVFVLNPLICGALSEPFARYEARVVWLVPFAALAITLSRGRRARSDEYPRT